MSAPYVLLVDDSEQDVELTLRAFKRAHLANEIVVKCDGADALEFLTGAQPPVLMLLDINLPRMTGIELLRRIRTIESLRYVPAIMLTCSTEEQDLIAAYDRGANSYVRKPVAFVDFAELVGRVGLYWILMNEVPGVRRRP